MYDRYFQVNIVFPKHNEADSICSDFALDQMVNNLTNVIATAICDWAVHSNKRCMVPAHCRDTNIVKIGLLSAEYCRFCINIDVP